MAAYLTGTSLQPRLGGPRTLAASGAVRLRRAVIGTDIRFTVSLGPSIVMLTENTTDAVATYQRLTSVPGGGAPAR